MVTHAHLYKRQQENEQLEIVQYLVKTCPTVDLIGQTNSDGWNSLHYAATESKKNVQTLQWLIDNYIGDIKQIINQKSNGLWIHTIRLCILVSINPLSKMTLSHCCVNMVEKPIVADKNGKFVGSGNGDLND